MINEIDENLDNILEIAENLPKVTRGVPPRVMPEINGVEEDTDFRYTRENLYNLLERGQDAVEELLEIAKQSEHPRAFEVVGQLIGKLTETNKELMGLHKTKKELSIEKSGGDVNVNNAVFVGSTAELQKLLKSKRT
jgi:predicted house-cleaning noncanonical NTP pyrophosphatase (MazG superfamily)|tara:strand:+ start:106 stop:516 length:411 start_codon:yes stop_codon:yes gene_type:complete